MQLPLEAKELISMALSFKGLVSLAQSIIMVL